MKQNKMDVYCLYCRQIVPQEAAAFVFRTGYYRNRFPLAGCHTCVKRMPPHLLPERTAANLSASRIHG